MKLRAKQSAQISCKAPKGSTFCLKPRAKRSDPIGYEVADAKKKRKRIRKRKRKTKRKKWGKIGKKRHDNLLH